MFRRRDKEKTVAEQTSKAPEEGAAQDLAAAQPLEPVTQNITAPAIDAEQEARWRREGIEPVTEVVRSPFLAKMSASAPVRGNAPAPLVSPVRIECEHCKGVGFVPGVNDLLKESIALVGNDGDEVVRLFYTTLLNENPALAYLFPPDITSAAHGTQGSKGAAQRDKLLGALVALADSYDPGDMDKMGRLTRELARFGRAHAGFVRQDGTTWGATLEEYKAVKDALFSTLVRVAGDKWRPEFTSAWSQAYDYAAAVMLAEQFRSGFTAPRFARA